MRRSEKLEVLPPETSSETFVGSKHRLTFLVTKGGLILVCLLLFLAVAGAFMPALKADFINFDDDVYVTKNPHVVGGLSAQNLRWAFLSMNTAANWHPLTWLAHMIDCQFFGLQPWGHHLMSILMHAANAVLLFLVLNRATGARGRSLFVAAVFGLHPLRVESVAWLSERKDIISSWLRIMTMGAYVLYVEQALIPAPKATSD